MSLTAGARLGPYEVIAKVGAGGMGEVYKARDTRLDRIVAIKKLLGPFTERFEREAHAIAALNHPNICSLYDVGADFLVMEFIDGRPLAGPLPFDQALPIARQILDALDAAHRKGIVHRDLKPGNILLTKTGVKLLDFGLAKAAGPAVPEMRTISEPLTGIGTIVGTPHYMAPEQIEGREADARTDIFAFGLVLHELITGKRAFDGASAASLMAAILKDPAPRISDQQPLSPRALDRIVQTCLAKDPDERWQSARELTHALDWIAEDSPAPVTPAAIASPRRVRTWQGIAGAAIAVAVAAVTFASWPRAVALPAPVRFEILPPPGMTFGTYVAVAPNAQHVAFTASDSDGVTRIWIRDLANPEARVLAGTEDPRGLIWSPDSATIAFSQPKSLKKIGIAGGPAQTIADVTFSPGSGAWLRDGPILIGTRVTGGIHRVNDAGERPTPLTVATGGPSSFPSPLPDGRHFLYSRAGPPVSGVFVGDLERTPEQQPTDPILHTTFGAAFVETVDGGRVLWLKDGVLLAQPFDGSTLKLTGEPVPVVERVANVNQYAAFSVSRQGGLLAYRTEAPAVLRQLMWRDRSGNPASGLFGTPGPHEQLTFSPTDESLLLERDAPGIAEGDFRVLDIRRDVPSQLTSDRARSGSAVWSPDGTRIAYAGLNAGKWELWTRLSNGTGKPERLVELGAVGQAVVSSWSGDGRFLLFHSLPEVGMGLGIYRVALNGVRKREAVLQTPAGESFGVLSPDNRWLAYVSNESGRSEIYVRSFVAATGEVGADRVTISNDGVPDTPETSQPGGGGTGRVTWRGDSGALVYRNLASALMSVTLDVADGRVKAGIPQRLFTIPVGAPWVMAKDGNRFLVAEQTGVAAKVPIHVVSNWESLLKR